MYQSFWSFLDQRVQGKEADVPWFVNDKLKAYKFLRDNDIRAPEVIKIYDNPSQINLAELPQQFCLKPSNMHSANGVLPLRKVSDGLFFDRLRKRFITSAAIFSEQERVFDMCKFKGTYKILVEESFPNIRKELLIPPDYKLYAFRTGIGLIMQIDRNGDQNNVAFFDGKFSPLENKSVVHDNLTFWKFGHPDLPPNFEKMLEIAARIPLLLNTPFVSVDMYSVKSGPYVGEITPAPGLPYYKKAFEFLPEIDENLGEMWAQSLSSAN